MSTGLSPPFLFLSLTFLSMVPDINAPLSLCKHFWAFIFFKKNLQVLSLTCNLTLSLGMNLRCKGCCKFQFLLKLPTSSNIPFQYSSSMTTMSILYTGFFKPPAIYLCGFSCIFIIQSVNCYYIFINYSLFYNQHFPHHSVKLG